MLLLINMFHAMTNRLIFVRSDCEYENVSSVIKKFRMESFDDSVDTRSIRVHNF